MISKEERAKMYRCADLLPPPGGDELKRTLASHAEADARIEKLEESAKWHDEAISNVHDARRRGNMRADEAEARVKELEASERAAVQRMVEAEEAMGRYMDQAKELETIIARVQPVWINVIKEDLARERAERPPTDPAEAP